MRKFLLSLCLLLCCVSVSRAQAEYPDVPLDDSAYEDINLLVQHNVLESDANRATSGRGMTRYEFAVAVARVLQNIKDEEFLATLGKRSIQNNVESMCMGLVSPLPPPTPWSKIKKENPTAVAALKRLSEEFSVELRALGISDQQIKSVFLPTTQVAPRKIEIAPQFSDVPKNHWAFSAVEKLRLGGIVIGFPDGSLVRPN